MDAIYLYIVDNHTDYYNHKGWYSMILQGVVDANHCFTDIYVGWPSSVHDARVFSHSPIYKQITEQELLPGNRTILMNSIEVHLYLIGDSAYPIQTWLMKPFPHNTQNLTNEKKTYNYRLSRARIVVLKMHMAD